MRINILVLLCCCFGVVLTSDSERASISQQQNPPTCHQCGATVNGNAVNAGASSSSQEQPLHRCQRCEISNYANRLVFMMLAEDRSGDESLINMMHTRYHEMDAFHNYVHNYIRMVRFGNGNQDLENDKVQRFEYFNYLMEDLILQIVHKTCSSHYSTDLYYDYHPESDQILVYERYGHGPEGECLCTNVDCSRERSMTYFPLPMIGFKPQGMTPIDLNINGEDLTYKLTVYHVIPPQLIAEFFRHWVGDNVREVNFPGFNNCVNMLLIRLKRSIQKIILVSMEKSFVFSKYVDPNDEPSEDDEILKVETIENNVSWMSGNMFIAPTFRGPFNPSFYKFGTDLFNAFETEAEPLIGPARYQELVNLFLSLQDFVSRAQFMYPFERLLYGFTIYTRMTLIFTLNPVTRFNHNDWLYRPLTFEELMNIQDRAARISMSYHKYFTTRKNNQPSPRPPRSVLNDQIKVSVSEEEASKIHWRAFVLDAMKITMEASSRNQSLPWSCDFARVYNKYVSQGIEPKAWDCSNCLDFAEFLYVKILKPNDWNKCHYTNIEVCFAWRNITENLDNRFNVVDYHEWGTKRIGNPRWREYLKNVGTVLNWLLSPVAIKEPVKIPEYKMLTFPKNPTQLLARSSTSDIAMCLFSTFVGTLITWKTDCTKLG